MKHIQYDDGLVSKGKYQQQHKEYSELFSSYRFNSFYCFKVYFFRLSEFTLNTRFTIKELMS